MIKHLFTALGAEHAARLRATLAGMVVAAVLQGVAFALLVPVLRALLGDAPADAWPWLGALTAVFVGYAVSTYVSQMAGYRAGAAVSRILHRRLGDHIAQLPIGWFTGDRVGRLTRLTSQSVVDVMGVPAHLLRQLVTAFATPATVVVVMAFFDWRLALTAAVGGVVVAVVYQWSGSRVRRGDHAADAVLADAGGRVVEFARNQPVLRAFGRSVDGHRLLDDALVAQRDAGRRLITVALPGVVGLAMAVQAAFTAMLLVGTYLAVGGSLGAPELLALLVLGARFVEPMVNAADLGGAMRMAANSLGRINAVLAEPTLPEAAEPVSTRGADIEFDRVHFGYTPRRPVLSGVSLRVPERTMTALVGASGSGKTTITRLVARFFDVDSGAVRIGGADVRDIAPSELASRVSLVFQDVYLFEGTIEDNVRLGKPDATDEEVRTAARLAAVDEIVDRLPLGWKTAVGEGGAQLSGGERQRVSIARALLKDAPIVLLDEPTAALDPVSEAAVQRALSALTENRTLIVVAHNLHTIARANQIVVLHDGVIAEQGNHEELLAHAGHYTRFWRNREQSRGWRLAGGRSAAQAH